MATWRRVLTTAAAVALLAGAAPARASIWTQLPTPAGTGDITGITYAGPGRIIFVTADGHVFHQVADGSFQEGTIQGAFGGPGPGDATHPDDFGRVAYAPDGSTAVFAGRGLIERSTDGGATWTYAAAFPAVFNSCLDPMSPTHFGANDFWYGWSVRWADDATVYVYADDFTLFKSTDAGLTWSEVNEDTNASMACRVSAPVVTAAGQSENVWDGAWLDAQRSYTDTTWLNASSDGDAFFFDGDGFSEGPPAVPHPAQRRTNVPTGGGRVAADPATGRVWVSGAGGPIDRSDDGGVSWHQVTTIEADGSAPYQYGQSFTRDLAFAGGTLVAVGGGGKLYTSPDGVHFGGHPVDGPDAANDWKAVAMYDAAHAVVAGAHGRVYVTDHADAPVPTPPSGQTTAPPDTSGTGTPVPITPPDPQGDTGAGSRTAQLATALRRGARLVAHHRRVTLRLSCPPGATAACAGTLHLVAASGGHRHALVSASYRIAPGATRTETLRFRGRGLSYARRHLRHGAITAAIVVREDGVEQLLGSVRIIGPDRV